MILWSIYVLKSLIFCFEKVLLRITSAIQRFFLMVTIHQIYSSFASSLFNRNGNYIVQGFGSWFRFWSFLHQVYLSKELPSFDWYTWRKSQQSLKQRLGIFFGAIQIMLGIKNLSLWPIQMLFYSVYDWIFNHHRLNINAFFSVRSS